MKKILNFLEEKLTWLANLSDIEPSNRVYQIISILGACVAEYVYITTSDEGYLLGVILVGIMGVLLGLLVFFIVRQIPYLLAGCIVSLIIIGMLNVITFLLDLVIHLRLW